MFCSSEKLLNWFQQEILLLQLSTDFNVSTLQNISSNLFNKRSASSEAATLTTLCCLSQRFENKNIFHIF